MSLKILTERDNKMMTSKKRLTDLQNQNNNSKVYVYKKQYRWEKCYQMKTSKIISKNNGNSCKNDRKKYVGLW
jgi:hypothetical protein